jgi:hypothetical protein
VLVFGARTRCPLEAGQQRRRARASTTAQYPTGPKRVCHASLQRGQGGCAAVLAPHAVQFLLLFLAQSLASAQLKQPMGAVALLALLQAGPARQWRLDLGGLRIACSRFRSWRSHAYEGAGPSLRTTASGMAPTSASMSVLIARWARWSWTSSCPARVSFSVRCRAAAARRSRRLDRHRQWTCRLGGVRC